MSSRPARARGLTLLEVMVGLAIFSILLAVGTPMMSDWLSANRAAGAAEFYEEGLRQARMEALSHNSESRLLLTTDATNGQYDWQIDLCFPAPDLPCTDETGNWSTPAAPAANDPAGANGFKSLVRVAAGLPGTDVLQLTLSPAAADQLYFTPVGWVDQNIATHLARLTIAPAPAKAGKFPTTALAVSLAGMANKCDPDAGSGDARVCPP